MKWDLVSGVVAVKQLIKNVKTPQQDIEPSMLEETIQAFIEKVLCYTFL